MGNRAPKGTPTALNLWTLAQCFAGRTTIPNRIEATRVRPVRKCIDAGLVVVVGADLVLTASGVAAIGGAK